MDKKIQITNSAVTLNQGNILSVSQNFTSTLSAINNTVQDQLDIISKMPGPQVISSLSSILDNLTKFTHAGTHRTQVLDCQ